MRSLKHPEAEIRANTSLFTCFGKKVKYYREVRHISQETLGGNAHLDRSYISNIECGKCNPSLLTMSKIAGALNVTISELICMSVN